MNTILGPRHLPRLILARDVGPDAVRALVRDGEVVKVGWGAYVEPVSGTFWEQQLHLALARVAAARARLHDETYVFSHITAALLHGCWLVPGDARVHILSMTKPRAQQPGLRRHVGDFGPDTVERADGVRLTSLPQTILDCAESLHPRWALVVADSGARILAQPDVFRREDSQHRLDLVRADLHDRMFLRVGHRGVVQARAIVEVMDGWSGSAGESSLRWVGLAGGLPPPVAQFPVAIGGTIYFVDLAWTVALSTCRERLIIAEEYDGREKYAVAAGDDPLAPLLAEKAREDALRLAGVQLRRRVAEDLLDPGRLLADMLSRFPESVARRASPVPGLYVPRDFGTLR